MSAIVYHAGTFCDVARHSDGWAFVVANDRIWTCYINNASIWSVDVGVKALYLRIAADPEGGVLALAQGDYPDGNLIAVYQGGPAVKLMPTVGQNSVVVQWDDLDEAYIAFVQITGTTALRLRLRGTVEQSDSFAIPETSQGFLGILEDRPLLTDANRLRTIRDVQVSMPNQDGQMVVGQWLDRPGIAAILLNEAVQFTAIHGFCYEPHVAALADGSYIVCARTEREGAAYRVLTSPWPLDDSASAPVVAPFAKPIWVGYFKSDGTEAQNCRTFDIADGFSDLETLDRHLIARVTEAGDVGTLRTRAQSYGSARTLVLGICDGFEPGGPVAGCDWLGLEAYARTPVEPATAVLVRISATLARLPLSQSVVIVGQAYGMGAPGAEWYRLPLLPLSEVAVQLSRDPRVVGLLWFSGRARRTGLGDHPELEPYHRAVLAAVPSLPAITVRPSSPISTPAPTPTPKPKENPMPVPYDESWIIQIGSEVRALYAEAGREPDMLYPVWTARTLYDHVAMGLSRDASWAKHHAELRQALSLPPL